MSKVQIYISNSKRAKEITNSLIETIAKTVLPFSIVKDTHFVNFVKVLNNRYELPNEDTLTSKDLPELYKIKCTEIMNRLSQVETVHFAIDSWTDTNRGLYFLAVTAHFCIGETLQHNILQVSHFSMGDEVERIQKTVALAVNKWKIGSKVKTIVSNCMNAVVDPPKRQILCFGHTLNLAVEVAIKNRQNIIDVIRKCRKIVEFLQTSDKAALLLGDLQIGESFPEILSLQRGAIGRWSSTYLMLNRMIQLQDTLASIPGLNENDWTMISEVVSVLEPLYLETINMSNDHYVTTSEIIPIIHRIEDGLKKLEILQSDVKHLRNNLLNQLDQYYENIKNNLVYMFATLLDPRYKDTMFRSKDSVKLIMKNLEEKDEYSSLPFTTELDKYLKLKVIIDNNPIKWWNTIGKKDFPKLVKPALEYLCIPALAAPSEHLFSDRG